MKTNEQSKHKLRNRHRTPGYLLICAVLILLAVVIFIPFWNSIVISFMPSSQVTLHPAAMLPYGFTLDNYENLLRFIRMLSDENGLNISQRNITVSTCGIVPRMYDLAEEDLQITLAISLHASNQEKRAELMPIANKYSITEVLDACRNYFEKTGRRLTFEYSLVGGKNDSQEDARELAELIKGLNCHVNLIPVNPIKERDFVQSGKKVIEKFQNKLEKYQINVTIRREMGRDIDGACGQLRKSYIDNKQCKEDKREDS